MRMLLHNFGKIMENNELSFMVNWKTVNEECKQMHALTVTYSAVAEETWQSYIMFSSFIGWFLEMGRIALPFLHATKRAKTNE